MLLLLEWLTGSSVGELIQWIDMGVGLFYTLIFGGLLGLGVCLFGYLIKAFNLTPKFKSPYLIVGSIFPIVIFLIIAFIPVSLPDPNRHRDQIKANMHALQTMVEIYNLDQHAYPENLMALYSHASRPDQNYWKKQYDNPFQGLKENSKRELKPFLVATRIKPKSISRYNFWTSKPSQYPPGTVVYQVLKQNTVYNIYGYGRHDLIRKDKRRVLILSNS